MKVLLVVLVACAAAGVAARTTASTTTTAVPGEQPDDIGSPLTVAQCRAQCLQRFTNTQAERPSQCLQSPDCYMCWENCQLLQSNFPVWGAMCNEKSLCFPGCQQACAFHRRSRRQQRQQQAVVLTGGLAAVRTHGPRASWPAPPPARTPARAPARAPARPLVYVLMRRTTQPAWTQITQTVDLSARLPEDAVVDRHSLRVLVVGPEGLETIYSPELEEPAAPAAPTSSSTAAPGRHHGSAPPPASAASLRRINTAIKPTLPGQGPQAPPPTPKEHTWLLREDSLIHQKVLVIAELSWAPRGSPGGVYLVTWEVDGGGLKGNLFTDSTHVTLSLWPDTVYHVQVELVSQSKQSASLVVDTRRAVPSTLGSRGPTASSRIPLSIAASSPASSSSSSTSAAAASPAVPQRQTAAADAALRRSPFLMLAPVPSKRHVAAEKHLGDAVRRPSSGATILAVVSGVVLVSLAVGAVLVWRCRGPFFRRGAGAVGDSSPFIGALAAEEGDLPPVKKSAGVLSAAFTAPPPTEVLAPVVTLVSEAEDDTRPSLPPLCSRSPSSDACQCCPHSASSPSWRHANMASSWTFAASPSRSSPSPPPAPSDRT